MSLLLEDLIFDLYGNFDKENDSNKDVNGRGTLERYNRMLGKDFDDNISDKIDFLLDNTIVPSTLLVRFIGLMENMLGMVAIKPSDEILRRKMIRFAFRFFNVVGTKVSYEMLFRFLGFDSLTFIEHIEDYTFDQGNIPNDFKRGYVLNNASGSVSVYDVTTQTHLTARDFGSGVLNDPRGMAIWNNKAYITSDPDGIVRVFDINTGVHLSAEDFGFGTLVNPRGIVIVAGKAYITGPVNVIYVFNIATKEHLTSEDIGIGAFANPQYIATNGTKVYVTDFSLKKVLVFDIASKVHLTAEDFGTGTLNGPIDIQIKGSIAYVTDYTNNRVYPYDINTQSLTGVTMGAGVLNQPIGCFLANGRCYVVGFASDEVEVFNVSTGAHIPGEDFGSGVLNDPIGGVFMGRDLDLYPDINNITFDDEFRRFDNSCPGCSDYTLKIYGTLPLTDELHKAIFISISLCEPINARLRAVYYNDTLLIGDDMLSIYIDQNGDLVYEDSGSPGTFFALDEFGNLLVGGDSAENYDLNEAGDVTFDTDL